MFIKEQFKFELLNETDSTLSCCRVTIIMELIKLSLLTVLVFIAVDCRRLSKLDKLDNVLAETSKLLDQLKREGMILFCVFN